jgi:hypothetical protein
MSDKIIKIEQEVESESVSDKLQPTSDENLTSDEAEDLIAQLVRTAAASPAFQQYLARRLADKDRMPIVSKVPLQKARSWSLSFGPRAVPPFGSVAEAVQPRCLFRGEEIVNAGDSGLLLSGLYVGRKAQLPANVTLSLDRFDEGSLDRGMRMDTCDPALTITFYIQNPTAATLTFAASLFGKAVL